MGINVLEREGVVIFKLSGRIIAPDVNEITAIVEETLAELSEPPKLVFDFKQVTGMDSSGLGAMMKIYAEIHPRGGKIAVINVSKHVKNLIVMARLITVFQNYDSEAEAIAALLAPSQ